MLPFHSQGTGCCFSSECIYPFPTIFSCYESTFNDWTVTFLSRVAQQKRPRTANDTT
jgi:hypothetical protein